MCFRFYQLKLLLSGSGELINMRLTTKIFLAIASTFIVFAVVLFILSQTVLLVSYKALEEEDARRNASRAVSALEAEIKALGSLNVGASWDDTYKFMAKR